MSGERQVSDSFRIGYDVGLGEARKKLELARSQLERVQVASWSPPDPVEAVTWAFYAYENAVVAGIGGQGDTLDQEPRGKGTSCAQVSGAGNFADGRRRKVDNIERATEGCSLRGARL